MNKLLNHTTAAISLLALTLTGCQDRLRGIGAEPDQGAERTSLTVTLRTEVGAFGATRADVTDAQDTEVPGATDTGEDLVKHLSLAMQPGILLFSDAPQAVPGKTNEYTVLFKDIHYPGERELRYSVYLGQRLPGLSLADFDADKEVTYDQLKTLTSDTGGFVMTSEAGTKKITLKPDITEPNETNGNYLSCDVERVVSKAQVTSLTRKSIDFSQFNEKYFSKGDVEGAAELSFFAGWCIAGSAKSAYLFSNHAGRRRTLGATTDADAGFYTDLTTVSAKGKGAGSYDLTKLSEVTSRETTLEGLLSHLLPIGYEGKTPTLHPGYNGPGEPGNEGSSEKPLSENDLFPELRSVASPYFLEHALNETKADRTPYPARVTFADITYAKIFLYLIGVDGYLKGYYLTSGGGTRESNPNYREAYNRVYISKYDSDNENDYEGLKNIPDSYDEPMETPEASWLAVSKPTPLLTDEANLRFERRYLVPVSDEWRTAHLDSKYMKSADEYISHEMLIPSDETYRFKKITFSDGPRWFFEMRDLPCAYYIGKQDGKLYNTLLAARAAGNSQSYKYSVLSCYLVPLNAQKGANDLVYNCDTRRNNIYDLWITGVSDMGYNYDPVDPTDPLLPKPEDNPDEPETVVPSVNTYPQAIRVKARILKWNYIHYSADLKAMTGDTK